MSAFWGAFLGSVFSWITLFVLAAISNNKEE